MDESQRAFESELVIGMGHCLMCRSIKGQQREKVEDYGGSNGGTHSSDHGVLITNNQAAISSSARQ